MKQQSLTESLETSNLQSTQIKFSYDLCNAMVSANIPFKKLENKHFRQFLETYCARAVPSESLIRKKYLDEVYINVFAEIKSVIENNYIWFTVDEKFEDVLGKNEGFNTLYKISMVLQGNHMDDLKINVPMKIFKYAPITSVDVERSFSIYKTILTNRRQSFTKENIEKYIILNCYKLKD